MSRVQAKEKATGRILFAREGGQKSELIEYRPRHGDHHGGHARLISGSWLIEDDPPYVLDDLRFEERFEVIKEVESDGTK